MRMLGFYDTIDGAKACLDGFTRQGLLNTTHSGMNKFDSPENPGFKLLQDSIKRLVNSAPATLKLRKPSKSTLML